MRSSILLPFALVAPLCLSVAGCLSDAAEGDAEGVADGAEEAVKGSDPCAFPHTKTVDVASASQLSSALSKAAPGTMIRLAAGTYKGQFGLKTSGTASAPVVVCGARQAVLDGGSTASGYGFHLEADHTILSGFTVTNSQKGIVLDGANDNLVRGVSVFDIGMEGVHFRAFSTGNTLDASEVRDTGKVSPGTGEAVYIGSSKNNWGSVTGGKPDKSDHNKVTNNKLGPNVGAELVDIKEGTTGAEITGNTFDGAGQSGENDADSFIDVKGNGAKISGNTGKNPLKDGFQTHVLVDGWGNDNVFSNNKVTLRSGKGGVGFSIAAQSSGNLITCDNTVSGGGLANVKCK